MAALMRSARFCSPAVQIPKLLRVISSGTSNTLTGLSATNFQTVDQSQVLEHMKSASLPINDQVFNSFITGHLRSNDPDSARNILDVMRQTDLDPTSMTYTVLAMGFAERGEVEEVKKYISQAEIENVALRPGQLLDVYSAFATSGHGQHAKEVLPFLQRGTPFNQDAIRVCNQLIATGYDDAAYQLFLEMPKPSRVDTDQSTLGRFFLRALARHERPVDRVVEVVTDMQKREVNKDDLSAVAQLAYLEGQPAYAVELLQKIKSEGLPVRAHYFWPALCQFRDANNAEGIYEVMEKMKSLSDSQDDFILTLHGYTIPALMATGQEMQQISSRLQSFGFEEKDINFAFFLYMLDGSQFEQALQFLEGHEVTVYMPSVRACLTLSASQEWKWRTILQMLAKLKAQGGGWKGPSLDTAAMVLKQLMASQRKAGWTEIQDLFNFMMDNGLKISKRSQQELSEYFAGAPIEVLQRLDDLAVSGPSGGAQRQTAEMLSPDLTLTELQRLAQQSPNNKSILKRLLIKACAVGNVEEAERVRTGLEAEGFVFPPLVLSQLAFLYATFAKDLDKAQDYLQQLESKFPEHQNYQTAILKTAALQASTGNTDGAVETLKRYAERHQEVVSKQELKRQENFTDIISGAVDADAAKKLLDTLTTCGYLPANSLILLNAYMDKLISSGDSERILQEFEEIVNTHKCSPKVDQVLQFFINKEDPDSLQKVVDLLTGVHGLMNVLHHLIADFVECGHVKKARKIMETPGLRANMQRLNYYCQSFIERGMIKELEMLVEVTKSMFAVDRDNMLFHLIRGYVKQKDMAKAQDVLLQYEEEMLQPSARTLRFLARSLEREGMPVPFEVPDFQPAQTDSGKRKGESGAAQPVTSDTSMAVTTSSASAAATQLKDSVQAGQLDQALELIQGGDSQLLAEALMQMKKPWPFNALLSLFEKLSQQGNLDSLKAITTKRLPPNLRSSLMAYTFAAALNSGRGEEVLATMETLAGNTAKYLTFSTLDALHTKAPQLVDRVEGLAKRLLSEKKYTEPLSIMWCYYKHNDSPKADAIMKEIPGFDKSVLTGTLCSAAVKESKADSLEWILKLKQGVGEKQGMAVAYSSLLLLNVDQGDVEAVEKVCQRILGDGLSRDDLRSNTVTRVENFLNQNNRPVPAWGQDSSSSDSSSSSDEEGR